ncbi:MAG: polysaccharide deacetylase family protein, partial [Pseudoxanthomonas sp.]
MTLSSRAGRRQRLARRSHAAGLLPVLRRLRSALRHDLRILAYHRVLESADPEGFSFDTELISATGDQFREQMRAIKRDFHPMRFDQVLSCIDANRRLPKGAILVTFDDGYDDNYRIAYPILRELGMSAMFFVSTGHIDSGMPYAYDWLVHMICTT